MTFRKGWYNQKEKTDAISDALESAGLVPKTPQWEIDIRPIWYASGIPERYHRRFLWAVRQILTSGVTKERIESDVGPEDGHKKAPGA